MIFSTFPRISCNLFHAIHHYVGVASLTVEQQRILELCEQNKTVTDICEIVGKDYRPVQVAISRIRAKGFNIPDGRKRYMGIVSNQLSTATN